MSVLKDNLVEQIEAVKSPLKERWHHLQAAYRFWNLATHHVLGFTIKLALLLYFAFTILFLALRWVILPNIDHYKGDIERLASSAVGNQVVINPVYASWKGLRPQLILGDVVMRDARGQQRCTCQACRPRCRGGACRPAACASNRWNSIGLKSMCGARPMARCTPPASISTWTRRAMARAPTGCCRSAKW